MTICSYCLLHCLHVFRNLMKNCKINSTAEIQNSIIANNSEIEDETRNKKIFLLGEGSKISL